ncbi:hypothetical protein D3C81_1406190 [compost metagenome]
MLQGLRVLVRLVVLKPVHSTDGEHTSLAGFRRQVLQYQLSELIQHTSCIVIREDDDRVRDSVWVTWSPKPNQSVRDGDIRERVGDRCNCLIKPEAAGDFQLTPRVWEGILQWRLLLEDLLVRIANANNAYIWIVVGKDPLKHSRLIRLGVLHLIDQHAWEAQAQCTAHGRLLIEQCVA